MFQIRSPRLHSFSLLERLRRGGTWHHLNTSGGISEEYEAAEINLDTFKA
jgi:hypothetical protein